MKITQIDLEDDRIDRCGLLFRDHSHSHWQLHNSRVEQQTSIDNKLFQKITYIVIARSIRRNLCLRKRKSSSCQSNVLLAISGTGFWSSRNGPKWKKKEEKKHEGETRNNLAYIYMPGLSYQKRGKWRYVVACCVRSVEDRNDMIIQGGKNC